LSVETRAAKSIFWISDSRGFVVHWSLVSNQFCHGSGTDGSRCRGRIRNPVAEVWADRVETDLLGILFQALVMFLFSIPVVIYADRF
jgi:hypothetical protein